MTSHNDSSSLEDVLDDLFFSADKPSSDIVLRACQAHPNYRADILQFAALWSTHEALPEPENISALSEISEDSVMRLQSFVLNRLHELDQQPTQDSDTSVAKTAVAALAGGALRRAASAAYLGSSTLLLQKILTKAIPDVPTRVISGLANHLNVTVTALLQALNGNLAVGRSYSASEKPNAPVKEKWECAVLALPVSDEEKSRLLALQKMEESP